MSPSEIDKGNRLTDTLSVSHTVVAKEVRGKLNDSHHGVRSTVESKRDRK